MRTDAPLVAEQEPIVSEYSPGETLALLKLRGSELADAVAAALERSTARATRDDKAALMAKRLIVIAKNGTHQLTPRGWFEANALARTLAPQLGIDPQRFVSRPRYRGFLRPGMFSQNGNW